MTFFQKAAASTFTAPIIVLIVGLASSALAAFHMGRIVEARDQDQIEHLTLQVEEQIQGRLETYIAMLRAGAGLIASQQRTLERDEFRLFVNQLQIATQYPGIRGIGYSARLPGDSKAALNEIAFRYALYDFTLYPPGDREEIHSIIHLEPMDRRNQAAIGYDMFTEPVRQEAMKRARDTGLPSVSGRVQLVQEIDDDTQAGFLIYVPVYRGGGVPRTLEQRRQLLLGFVYSPFRADDLMRGIFGVAARQPIDIEVFDTEPAANNLLHRSFKEGQDHVHFAATRTINIAGRPWSIRYWVRPEFQASSGKAFVPLILFGGVLATLILTGLSWSQARARRRADKAAAALRANARKLEVLHATAGRLSAQLDADRLVQEITDAGRELTGAEIGAFFYNVVDDTGAHFSLYTLSGAPREAFASMGMPRKTQLFQSTFRGEGVVRADDITADSRFGKNEPHHGLPAGHWPVRSYLAVPVISRTGEVLGGLLFGHSQVAVFDAESEHSVVALAGHAAIAMDNARLFKASQDEIAARKRIEEHQKLLLDELNHRVKNTLATVQSIAAQTIRSSPEPRAFRQAFEARLIALSQAHNLLSLSNWRGVELTDLVRRELTPHGIDDPNRICVTGEQVTLPPAIAVAIGMAFHELATNAARHGALSSTTGKVEVSWSVSSSADARHLRIIWKESGGPTVHEPRRRGFGSRLIEQGLKHDLHGEAKLSFESSGLKCVIEAVLPAERAAA
jgi:two-component sensor histidine kinase/CHASE1-domain containing sensor protein